LISVTFVREITNAEFSVELAEALEKRVSLLIQGHPGKIFNVLIDFSPLAGRTRNASSFRARRIYARLAAHKQAGNFGIVTDNVFIKNFINIIFRFSGKGEKMKFFNDRDEAAEWLKKSK